jgi:tetratricopeptide (TPR) repeat protein
LVPGVGASPVYDLFLSYHWKDHETVLLVAEALRKAGLTPFYDRWYLAPGADWVEALEKNLSDCKAVAVFLGPSGLGDWQQREKRYALNRQAKDTTFPVIPVLLAGAEPASGFLALNTWITLSDARDPVKINELVRAARGQPPEGDGPSAPDPRAAICPYRGLAAFQEEHEAFFCGREEFTNTLVKAVATRSLIAVVGPSGSGKSSVVRAGLVPALRRGQDRRVWDMVAMTPQTQPLHALAKALIRLIEPEMSGHGKFVETGKWANSLAADETALDSLVDLCLEKQNGTDCLLLMIDQWEELYTMCRDSAQRDAFIKHILRASKSDKLTVVLTLRSDFLRKGLNDAALAERLRDGTFHISTMTRAELHRAIEEPAKKVGLRFEQGLVGVILDEVGEEPGKLPLLEFLLLELWKRRQHNTLLHGAFDTLGGVGKAIAATAEREFEKLDEAEQIAARWALVQLVTPGEGQEDTRRKALLSELEPAAADVITKFATARLLVTTRDSLNREVVEVGHEALIREWQRLREWVDQDRSFLGTQIRLREEADFWNKGLRRADLLLSVGRIAEASEFLKERPKLAGPQLRAYVEASLAADQAQRQAQQKAEHKRLVQWVYALGAAAVILLCVVGFALYQMGVAKEQAQLARHQTGIAREQAQLALYHTGVAQEQAQLAQRNLQTTLRVTANVVEKVGGYVSAGNISIVGAQELLKEAEQTLEDLKKFQHAEAITREQARLLLSVSDLQVHLGYTDRALKTLAEARRQIASLPADDEAGIPLARTRQWLSYAAAFRIGDSLEQQSHLDEALLEQREASRIADEAASRSSHNLAWDVEQPFVRNKIGDVLRIQGFLKSAEDQYNRALEAAQKFARVDAVAAGRRQLATVYERLGQVKRLRGNLKQALDDFLAGLEIRKELSARRPDNAGLKTNLAAGHSQVGGVLLDQGDLEGAAGHFESNLKIVSALIERDSSRANWQRMHASALTELGDLAKANRNFQSALGAYRQAAEIKQRLADRDHLNALWAGNVALNHIKIGEALLADGQRDEALREFETALKASKKLADKHPDSADRQSEYLRSLMSAGHAYAERNNSAAAKWHFQEALKIAEERISKLRDNAQWQGLLSNAQLALGDFLKAQGELSTALQRYEAALAVTTELAGRDPDAGTHQFQLAKINVKIAEVLIALRRLASALGPGIQPLENPLSRYRTAVGLMEKLVANYQHNRHWNDELAALRRKMEGMASAGEAN